MNPNDQNLHGASASQSRRAKNRPHRADDGCVFAIQNHTRGLTFLKFEFRIAFEIGSRLLTKVRRLTHRA
jgi:hypothetical protein